MEGVCLVNPPLSEAAQHLKNDKFFWLDLKDPSDADIKQLGEMLDLHPLTIDDATQFGERPKFEDYPGYVYLVAYGADPDLAQERDEDPDSTFLHEIHMIISGSCVVTIRRQDLAVLDEVRKRTAGADLKSEQMLVYRILDAITSTFFPVLSEVDEQIDEIEDQVIESPTEEALRKIFILKRNLVAMRRVVTPMRDVFARNAERIADVKGIEPDDRLYYRDIYDTLIRVSDLVDSYRDMLSGATDLYLSTIANRQGEVNKSLTIIATIFLPLTFLTGFFGQNFSFLVVHILSGALSFLLLGVGLLLLSTIGFIVYFRTRRWI